MTTPYRSYTLKLTMTYCSHRPQDALARRLEHLAFDLRMGRDVTTRAAGGGAGGYSFTEEIDLQAIE